MRSCPSTSLVFTFCLQQQQQVCIHCTKGFNNKDKAVKYGTHVRVAHVYIYGQNESTHLFIAHLYYNPPGDPVSHS